MRPKARGLTWNGLPPSLAREDGRNDEMDRPPALGEAPQCSTAGSVNPSCCNCNCRQPDVAT
jgi:hypothetical protein